MNAPLPHALLAPAGARIGPNAITRVAEALQALHGDAEARAMFASCGLAHHLDHPPETMVDEADVAVLAAALRRALPDGEARRVAAQAGRATGDYLLACRIPRAAQAVLRALPAALAAPLLLSAIRRHAWTFAGSGRFVARTGRPVRLTIAGNPMCRGIVAAAPACDYYAATFERLFRVLVHPRATVVETDCIACGADACRFVIDW
jgi:divinyl protochlorophyllide a 8-vinyl-reductase